MEAYKYIVKKKGEITMPDIPDIKSSKAKAIILQIKDDDFSEIVNVSESSIDFWDNQEDEVWNEL
ncbi:MAG: DUF2281 domain-containing protein [candidate division KSB1 bacterium]|nr:DUF2281 domain-containing protein [candidate division KSB1 bacterium]